MTEPICGQQTPEFKDKHVRLILLGVLQLIMGGMCAMITLGVTVGVLVSVLFAPETGPESTSLASMAMPLFFYSGAVVWFIAMGVGSINAERWARALSLVSSWAWFAMGVGTAVGGVGYLPMLQAQIGTAGAFPDDISRIIVGFIFGMMVFSLLIPGGMALLYSGRHVKATCDHRHPTPSWTDKCPLPVLALSYVAITWGIPVGGMMLSSGLAPCFGTFMTGLPAQLMALLVLLLSGYIAWGAYALRVSAWWSATITFVVVFGSMLITVLFSDPEEILAFFFVLSEEEIAVLNLEMMPSTAFMVTTNALWFVGVMGFLIYIKRYFNAAAPFLPEQSQRSTSES